LLLNRNCAFLLTRTDTDIVEASAILLREEKGIKLTSQPSVIHDQDHIHTLESGKIRLNLMGGDTIFLALNTEIHFNKN